MTSDEIRTVQARLRKLGAELDASFRDRTGTCRHFVGQVFTNGTLPTSSDRYFLTHPVTLSGNEIENTTPTIVVDESITVPVLIIGTPLPAVGDRVIAELVDHTWVADRWGSAPGGPIVIGPPGCICTAVPISLSLTLTFGSGETSATYGNAYRPASLIWCPAGSPPSYMPPSEFFGPGFYSTESWINDYGFENCYRLACFSSQWSLALGERATFETWNSPGQFYNWAIGGSKTAPNACSPFLLFTGQKQGGVFFNGKIFVSG